MRRTPVPWTSLCASLALLVCIKLAIFGGSACGGPDKPPKRGIIEGDIADWGYRRYQSVLDIEVWVPENKAVAYTASYAKKSSERRGRLGNEDVVHAFVTRYQRHTGVMRALVKFVRRLGQISGYQVTERRLEGIRLFEVQGPDERWLLWGAKRHIVKLGGLGRTDVPKSLLTAYGALYPSLVTKNLLEGPLPFGPDEEPAVDQPFDPDSPSPEWK